MPRATGPDHRNRIRSQLHFNRLHPYFIDYNGSNALYQGAAAMMSLGFEQEDDEHIVGPTAVKADGMKGMDTFYKKDGRAEMTLAVGGRFLLTLQAGKQKDMALLKSVAEGMDLAKL